MSALKRKKKQGQSSKADENGEVVLEFDAASDPAEAKSENFSLDLSHAETTASKGQAGTRRKGDSD